MPNAARIVLAATTTFGLAVGLTAVTDGHGTHGSARAPKPTPEEISAFAAAKPAFERHCFRCHTTTGKKSKRKALAHLSMNRYPFAGHHASEAGAVIRNVLGASPGVKATMPSDDPGAVTGDDLAKILTWADEFTRAHTDKEKQHAH